MTGSLQLPPPFDHFLACPQRFLWHAATRTAIFSDVHLGAEESLAAQGIYLPDTSTAPIRTAWQQVLAQNPAHILIAGDLFDSTNLAATAISLFQSLLAAVPAHCRITLTPGNHDPHPDALCPLFPILHIESTVVIDNITICHGHDLPTPLPKAFIIGHQHPTISLHSRIQSAKMVCFATCTLPKNRALLLLPAFSPLPLGTNLHTERLWLIDLPRPEKKNIRIAGIVAPKTPPPPPTVLDFGPLDALE